MLARNAARVAFTAARGAAHTQVVARAPASVPVAAPTRLLPLARPDSSTRSIFQARHYSSADAPASTAGDNGSSKVAKAKATLWPPWQVSDLRRLEQEAYQEHGADYVSHLSPDQRRSSRRLADLRRHLEKNFKLELGETHWYEIQKEGYTRFLEMDMTMKEGFKRRQAELQNETGTEADRAKEELREEEQRWHDQRLDKKRELQHQVAEEFKQRFAE